MTPTEFDWSIDRECTHGCGEAQLREQSGDRYPAFEGHMLMTANPVCTGRRGLSPPELLERSCGAAHGNVFYMHDVIRFVDSA
ncbi:hypothetical protein MUN78_08090 [Leucobacter allii]|uniref:Uncharacterized protein n=1 Tax=Leucobacter allii TaxID=2932247 RepID=A0ABY4FRH2_9MICO|nr:hypothetical protein [Leucobacter allii]UOQ58764.1 hypothetical protein MUN78_08090 [Leucobacter allii]